MPERVLLRFIDDDNSPARIFLLWIDSVPSAFREVTVLGAPHEYTHICIHSVVQLPDYFFLLVPKSSDHAILRSLDPDLCESPRCQLRLALWDFRSVAASRKQATRNDKYKNVRHSFSRKNDLQIIALIRSAIIAHDAESGSAFAFPMAESAGYLHCCHSHSQPSHPAGALLFARFFAYSAHRLRSPRPAT